MVYSYRVKSRVKCPECNSKNTWKSGIIPTRKGKRTRLKCKECGRTFYGKYIPKTKKGVSK